MSVSKESTYYKSCRVDLIDLIPEKCKFILDIGCGEGLTGKEIKRIRMDAKVWGIEYIPETAAKAKNHLDHVLVGDVENLVSQFEGITFDCLIFGDILEHLVDPWNTLRNYCNFLSDDGYVVISVPNVQHYSIIINLIRGHWIYKGRGILDRTHLRFFTREGVINLVEYAGLTPLLINCNVRLREHKRSGSQKVGTITKCMPFLRDYFVFQYIVLASIQKDK